MLNKSKGNMYKFVTHTWNTIKGQCPHDCSYCYMKRRGKQSPVHLDEKELKTDLGSGNFIFVGSSCDMFAEDIPTEWIRETLAHCAEFDNRYLFQSKNPGRMRHWIPYVSKVVACTTIETNRWHKDIMGGSPSPPIERTEDMCWIGAPTYLTIEPIMDFDLDDLVEMVDLVDPIQVNIGADSGNNNLPEPSAEKVRELIARLEEFTRVVQKKNLKRLKETPATRAE